MYASVEVCTLSRSCEIKGGPLLLQAKMWSLRCDFHKRDTARLLQVEVLSLWSFCGLKGGWIMSALGNVVTSTNVQCSSNTSRTTLAIADAAYIPGRRIHSHSDLVSHYRECINHYCYRCKRMIPREDAGGHTCDRKSCACGLLLLAEDAAGHKCAKRVCVP